MALEYFWSKIIDRVTSSPNELSWYNYEVAITVHIALKCSKAITSAFITFYASISAFLWFEVVKNFILLFTIILRLQ